MAATYEPIASVTLASDAADIEFTSLPTSYTDLVLIAMTRSGRSAGDDDLRMRFNADSTSNYSATMLRGTGSAADSARDSSQSYLGRTATVAATGTANVFTPIIFNIFSYQNTNVYKTTLAGSNAADTDLRRVVGLWRSTSAITSIKVYAANGNLLTGSTLSLYGIKAA